MLSPYRIPPIITNKRSKKVLNTSFDKSWSPKRDLKRLQLTSNHLVKPDTNTKSKKRNRNTLNSGSMHENFEIKEHYLDKILHKNDLKMQLAMQIISND